jgi:hypothetical protein
MWGFSFAQPPLAAASLTYLVAERSRSYQISEQMMTYQKMGEMPSGRSVETRELCDYFKIYV